MTSFLDTLQSLGTMLEYRRPEEWRRERETIGRFLLSIQASPLHYCRPKTFLKNIDEYESVEIAIFEVGDDGESWIRPRDDERFRRCGWAKHFESGMNPVAGYVPIGDLPSVRRALQRRVRP